MNSLYTLKTPCLVLDIERVRKNAERVSKIALRHNVNLRPHIKTHKCVEIAKIQTAEHLGGVTVSTLAEARAFSKFGFDDFTYAVPIEPGKFSEVIEIVKSGVNLNVITDDAEIPPVLNEAAKKSDVKINVFVEIDCGDNRSGVLPSSPQAVEIPRFIADASNLNFAGILTHAGHSYEARSIERIKKIAAEERDTMVALAEKLRVENIEVRCVSIGSTPTINHVDHLEGITEVRPGNYIFFDAFQATLGSCSFADCALTVLAAVVHRSFEQKKIIVDAGAIALSKDRGAFLLDENCGYGRVLDLDGNELGLRINGVSQEHGVIKVENEELLQKLKVGSRVRILTNHSCLSAAQHTHFNILQNGEIVDEWVIHRGW